MTTQTHNTNTNTPLEILHKEQLALGGFAGLKEHRIVTDSKLFRHRKQPDTWEGLGNFVYLADATFNPHGETGLHPHHEIDIISVMVEGRIAHDGSMAAGQIVNAPDVQVQRAGGEGFTHNETNPDDIPNRMIQIWVLPEHPGQPAAYKSYQPQDNHTTRIYGGPPQNTSTFPSHTTIDIARLNTNQSITLDKPFIAYMTNGSGTANGHPIKDGHIIRGQQLNFTANQPAQLIIIQTE